MLLVLVPLGLTVVIWVLYPITMALFSTAMRDYPDLLEPEPDLVSVVIATRERPECLEVRILDILRTEWPADRLEIVVGLDSSCPGHDAIDGLLSLGPVRIVRSAGPEGKAAALNAAVRETRGAVVVFADSHQRFSPETIPLLVEEVRKHRVGAASGRLVLPGRAGSAVELYWVYETWLRQCESEVHSCVGVTGAVYAMRRSLWRDLPSGLILDDVYAPMRLVLDGWKVKYVPDALAFETRKHSSGDEYKRKLRTLAGNIQLMSWLPDVMSPLRNPLWAQFMIHKPLRLLTPYLMLSGCVGVIALGIPYLHSSFLVIAGLFFGWLAWSRSALAEAARGVIHESVLLLGAATVGTWFGLRGKFDVWGATRSVTRIE